MRAEVDIAAVKVRAVWTAVYGVRGWGRDREGVKEGIRAAFMNRANITPRQSNKRLLMNFELGLSGCVGKKERAFAHHDIQSANRPMRLTHLSQHLWIARIQQYPHRDEPGGTAQLHPASSWSVGGWMSLSSSPCCCWSHR